MFEDLIDALDREMMLGEAVTDEEYNQAQQQEHGPLQSQQHMQNTNQLQPQMQQLEGYDFQRHNAGRGESQVVNQAPAAAAPLSRDSSSGDRGADLLAPSRGEQGEHAGDITGEVSGHIDLLSRGDKEKLLEAEARQKIANDAYTWPSMTKAKELWRNAEPGNLLSRNLSQDSEDFGQTELGGRVARSNSYKWIPGSSPGKQQQHQFQQQSTAGGGGTAPHSGGGPTSAGGALTPAEDAHIQKVTENFCQWVAELGGDSNNIDESTVMGLFSGGYESKPALSAPIHVVELTNVPPELRMNSAAPGQSRMSSTQTPGTAEADSRLLNAGYVHTKPTKAVRYGAWYLKPKQWRKLKPGEDIVDPNQKEGVYSEAKRRSVALDSELSSMHGAKEFIKFMRHKGNSVPDFLSRVAALQQDESAPNSKTNGSNSGVQPIHNSTPTRNVSRNTAAPTPSDSKSNK